MISIYERRRREPIYFQMCAGNALQAARLLEGAVLEAFWRKASLALELIAKAVIAQRLEIGEDLGGMTRVPVSHNVPRLWTDASLPSLSREDYGRLVKARVFLMWAGRYPAPNRDEDGERDDAELWEHYRPASSVCTIGSGVLVIQTARHGDIAWVDRRPRRSLRARSGSECVKRAARVRAAA
jgi:hypothetical protein